MSRRWTRRRWLATSGGAAAAVWLAAGAKRALADDRAGPDWTIHGEIPPNAEPRLELLVNDWITPVKHFYVRSHAATPVIRGEDFRLQIEGLVRRPVTLSLAELQERFPQRTTTATLVCAGNRREEHSLTKPVGGVPWGAGAIGNAEWGGAQLAEVLKLAEPTAEAKHVWFEGADRVEHDGGIIGFGGSIPWEKVMAPAEPGAAAGPGPLLAYEMNGEPLTPDHGFPLRSLVPGFIGARSVKWLHKVVVSDRPSPNHYVADAYKVVVEGTEDEWKRTAPIYEYPLNAAACVPAREARVEPGPLTVRGYALASGLPQLTVAKVEVSTDGGRNWRQAEFTRPARPFCWRLWTARVDVQPGTQAIVVRATDSAGNVQPAQVDWNLKGYMFNAWHRTPISVGS